jgi:hypothetical protein
MTNIEQQVMAGVMVVYAARRLTSAFALKMYALALSAFGIVLFVSLSNVAENFTTVAEGGAASVAVFLFSAIVGTTAVVQLALAVGAFAAASLAVDAVRFVSPLRAHTA